MKIIAQSNFFSLVERVHNDELYAKSFYVSTGYEATGWLKVALDNFRVKDARWDIFRSPNNILNGGDYVDKLKGETAYLAIGSKLRQAPGDEREGLPREVLAECVRAIIQAESFLYVERGFPTAQAYEEHWNKMYLNSCRFYSNLDRVEQQWCEHVGDYPREQNLFNRSKGCVICRQADGSLLATGSFIDSFHELGIYVSLSEKGIVTSCTGSFLRAPDHVCFENTRHLNLLAGNNIINMSKKDIGKIAGGSEGCDHLVDMLNEIRRQLIGVCDKLTG